MSTICTICERNFATSFNLKRHMEAAHLEQEDNENETESDSESEGESEGKGDNEKSKNYESSENSEDSEDSDNYTYDEVRAILRYSLKSSES